MQTKLEKVFKKREDELKKDSQYNSTYVPCVSRQMRLDDRIKRVYLQREAIKMKYGGVLSSTKQRRIDDLLKGTKGIEAKYFAKCKNFNAKLWNKKP